MGFGKRIVHQNHWNQHQKHLLLRLLRVLALEGQQHWRGWGWSCGGYEEKPGGDLFQYMKGLGKSKTLVKIC